MINRVRDLSQRNQVLQTAIGGCLEPGPRAALCGKQHTLTGVSGCGARQVVSQSWLLIKTNWERTLKTLCSVKETRHRKTNIVCFHLYEAPGIGKFIETESRMVVAKGWRGRGSWGVCVGDDGKVLGRDSGDSYTTL